MSGGKSDRPTSALSSLDPLKTFVSHVDRTQLPSGRYSWAVGSDVHQVAVKHVGAGTAVTSCRTRDLRSFFAGDGAITKEQ